VDINSAAGSAQLYLIDVGNGTATTVGSGFVVPVSTSAPTYGFDFNPTTLQPDGSVRIRLVSSDGLNRRLNSNTGAVSNTDLGLTAGNAIDSVAYTNTAVAVIPGGGTTTLYGIDVTSDRLRTIIPPNDGTVNDVGSLGASVDALAGVGFDIYTDPNTASNTGFAVIKRTATAGGQYLLYNVNLGTGEISNGALVDGGRDFTGGLAIADIPEPGTLGLIGIGALVLAWRRYRA